MHGVEDALVDGLAGEFGVVGADGFGDLGSDGHDGVERGHGLLEDHGDVAAAVAAHGGFGREVRSRSVAGEADVSGDVGGVGEEAEDGERGGGFAGAGFADQAEGFAGIDVEGDILDGGVLAEADGEVGDFEERRGFHWQMLLKIVVRMWLFVW